MSARPGLIFRVLRFLWDTLNFVRRLVLNLLFLAIVAAVVAALMIERPPALEQNTALVLDIKGPIVEQHSGAATSVTLLQALAERDRETQLRDVLNALDAAAHDPAVARVVLLLDDFEGAGLATLREVGSAIARFRASGKPVIAWAERYDQRRYYLAAHADEVYVDPFGGVLLQGLGGYRNYYRDALDRIGVTVNVFRVGEYKSAVEPFSRNGPSDDARRDETALLEDLWSQYQSAVEGARRLPPGSIGRMIDELPQRFAAVDGDAAKLALQEKLVDGLMTRDELRSLLISKGVEDLDRKSFRQVSLPAYLATLAERGGDAVGVVIAAGEILEGEQPQGLVGGRSTAQLIRRARENPTVKALVLRVDSPGGSVFASEVIRREMEMTQKAGKPVVVSFGDVAASGGYWISTSADELIADPGTVTGSIGVFALIPTAEKAWDKLSLHTDGVTTTWLAGGLDLRRPLQPQVRQLLQNGVARTYQEFVTRVARARDIAPERVNELAQGRVWSGRQALDIKLVDRLGSYSDALQAAAKRAGLAEGYRVAYIEREPRGIDRLVGVLLGEAIGSSPTLHAWLQSLAGVPRSLRSLSEDFAWLRDAARDPMALQSHCLCSARDLL